VRQFGSLADMMEATIKIDSMMEGIDDFEKQRARCRAKGLSEESKSDSDRAATYSLNPSFPPSGTYDSLTQYAPLFRTLVYYSV
jgi:hypothetical protein